MTQKDFEENWISRGYSFAVGQIKLQEGVNNAVHDDLDELVVMVNGKLEFSIDGETHIPDCNQEVFIPAKASHSIKNIGDGDSTIYFGYKKIEA